MAPVSDAVASLGHLPDDGQVPGGQGTAPTDAANANGLADDVDASEKKVPALPASVEHDTASGEVTSDSPAETSAPMAGEKEEEEERAAQIVPEDAAQASMACATPGGELPPSQVEDESAPGPAQPLASDTPSAKHGDEERRTSLASVEAAKKTSSKSKGDKKGDKSKGADGAVEDPLADPSNYRRYYQAVFTAFKTETEDLPGFLTVASDCVREALEDRIEPVERRSHFLRMALPKFVLYLMGRTDLENDEAVNKLLLEIMDLCITLVPQDIRELHNILARIMTPSLPYYVGTEQSQKAKKAFRDKTRLARTNADIDAACAKFLPENCIRVASAVICEPPASAFYYANVCAMATKGGFSAILERIPLIDEKALGLLKSMVKVTLQCHEFLHEEFCAQYIPELKEAVFERMLASNSGPLQSDERDQFKELARSVRTLLHHVLTDRDATEALDAFSLEVGLSGFESENLERRLRGLKMIKSAVRRAMASMEEKEKGMFSSVTKVFSNKEETNRLLPIDPAFVTRWLAEHNVVDRLFHTKSHPEEIKQAILIARFLACQKQLKAKSLDALWELSLGKHESVQHTIFEALIDLTEDLPEEHVDHLFENINAITEEDIDLQTLSFIARFSALAMKKDSTNTKSYGLSLLYKLAMATGGNEKVASEAFALLVKLLKSEACATRRLEYSSKCAKNLAKHASTPQSVELLHKLILMYPVKKRRGKESVRSVIELLEQRYALTDELLRDLEKYKADVADVPTEQLLPDSGEKLDGRYQYMEQIKLRLSFLEMITKNSMVCLNKRQADSLWESLVANCRVDEERSLCFLWLDNAREGSQQGQGLFTTEVMAFLFQEKMCKLAPADLTLAGYALFEKYFLRVNLLSNRIRLLDSSKKLAFENYYMFAGDLEGYAHLWDIALEVSDNEIARKAVRCLNTLHQYVPVESMQPRSAKLREAFMKQTMVNLNQAFEVQDTRAVSRCLYLLRSLVDMFDAKRKAVLAGPSEVQLQITPSGKAANFMITVKPTDTITTVRQLISEKYGLAPHKITVSMGQTELKDSNRTVQAAKLEGQNLTVVRRMANGENLEKDGKFEDHLDEYSLRALLVETLGLTLKSIGVDPAVLFRLPELQRTLAIADEKVVITSDHPAHLLAKEVYFRDLYKLLDGGEDVAREAWVLLGKLDTNAALVDDLKKASNLEAKLDEFLGSTVVFKLAHSLAALHSAVEQAVAAEAHRWLQALLDAGAVAKVMHTLMSIPTERSSGPLACFWRCLALLNLCHSAEMMLREAAKKTTSPGKWKPLLVRASLKEEGVLSRLLQLMMCCAGTDKLRLSSFAVNEADGPRDVVAGHVRHDAIVEEALAQLSVITVYHEKSLQALFGLPERQDWLRALILSCPLIKIRSAFAKGMVDWSRSLKSAKPVDDGEKEEVVEAPVMRLLKGLLEFLPGVADFSRTADKYFGLLGDLLALCSSVVSEDWVTGLMHQLVAQLMAHPVLESSDVVEGQDKALIGMLALARDLLRQRPALKVHCHSVGLVQSLLVDCLFSMPTADHHGPTSPPKCKTKAARDAAFALLVELSSGQPAIFHDVATWLREQMATVSPLSGRQLVRAHAKPGHGYVGLQNMGATCYMNSLLQQLYIMPLFRTAILALEDPSEDKSDSVLFQMQLMFANLQESMLRSFHPGGFAGSYKDYDGNPINPAQQQDANEFFNMLFDKLEGFFAMGEDKLFLQGMFGGKLANQIISQDCEHVSENTEHFYTVGIEVKHKSNILSSFDLFVEGEMLSGDAQYYCEACDNRVDAIKRCCIKHLPDVLVVQLKRFEFDLRNMRNVKLNDRCEFPVELNMEPYTVEGLARRDGQTDLADALRHPPEYYQYELRGIVVHTGTAECGHYYSFIKERKEEGHNNWFEFNDADVAPWNIGRLEKACFGGKDQFKQRNPQTGELDTVTRDVANNAYILVYERKTFGTEPSTAASNATVAEDGKPLVSIPPGIVDEIWCNNKEFISEQHIYSETYFSFMWRLVLLYTWAFEAEGGSKGGKEGKEGKSGSKESKAVRTLPFDTLTPQEQDTALEAVDLATTFVIEVFSRSKDMTHFPMWMYHLRSIFLDVEPTCRSLLKRLTANKKLLVHMLMLSPMERTRTAFSALLGDVIATLAPVERKQYRAQYEALQKGKSSVPADEVTSWLCIFIEALMSTLPEARSVGRFSNAQYFAVIRLFAEEGRAEHALTLAQRKYLLSRSLVRKLVNFVLGEGPFKEVKESKKQGSSFSKSSSSSRRGPINISHPCKVLACLIRGCEPSKPSKEWQIKPPPTCHKGDLMAFHSDDLQAVCNPEFITRLFRECHNDLVISDLVVHLCWEEKERSKEFLSLLQESMTDLMSPSAIKQHLACLTTFQAMADTIQRERIPMTLKLLLAVMEIHLEDNKLELCRQGKKYLAVRAKESALVKMWCSRNSSRITAITNRIPAPPPSRR